MAEISDVALSATEWTYEFVTLGGTNYMIIKKGSTVPYGPVMDVFPLTACNGAWSVNERIVRSYASNLLKVRRASDNTTQDIGFVAATGKVDTAAIVTFCAGTAGYVHTMYDQSGNSRNLTQTTNANQPQIYTGTAFYLCGTNVGFRCTSTQYLTRADAAGFSGSPAVTAIALCNPGTSTQATVVSLGALSGGSDMELFVIGTTQCAVGIYGGGAYYTLAGAGYGHVIFQHAASAIMGNLTIRRNGVQATPPGTAGTFNIATSAMYVGSTGSGNQMDLEYSTLVLLNQTLNAAELAAAEAWLEMRRVA